MKLNTRSEAKDSDSNESFPDLTLAGRSDRTMSREELCGLLSANQRAVVFEKKASPLSWLDKVALWISTALWKKTAIGYQDEQGFHYGAPPAKKESHAISD